MRIVIWGLGEFYNKYKWLIEQNEVIAFTDGNKYMWGRDVDGRKVVSPQEIFKFQWDYVFITTTAIRPIYCSLRSMGVSHEKIRCYYDFKDIFRKAKVFKYGFSNLTDNKNTIALVSQDLETNGACRCLLTAAEVYVKNGYDVILASPVDGVMRDEFLKIGCKIVLDQKLFISNIKECEWIAGSIFVIINTLQMFYLLFERNTDIPVVWWLHEPNYYYKCVCGDRLLDIDYENMYVMPVSNVAGKAFFDEVGWVRSEQLVYGICDVYNQFAHRQCYKEKAVIKFITVGTVCEIKGIDFLADVVVGLPEEIINQCEFLVVGDDDSIYAEKIKEFCQRNKLPIRFAGLCNHNRTIEMISDSDVFLCSSKIESMSIAVEEAMMMKKAVIVPDSAGNAQFVDEEKNGWVYRACDITDLRKTIEDCVNKRTNLRIMGENGRKVFLRNFEYSIFERRMLELAERQKEQKIVR